MNFARVGLAAVAAWAASWPVRAAAVAYLRTEFAAAQPPLFRPAADTRFGLGFGIELLGCFALAYMYAKGYEGTSGVQEGLRFGMLVGLVLATFGVGWTAVLQPAPAGFAAVSALDTLVEMTLYGIVIGLVYRPHPSLPERRP